MNPVAGASGTQRRWPAGRWVVTAAAFLLLGAVVAAPYLPADQLQGYLQAELERVLGRRVEIQGGLRLRAIPQPGITAANVVIHEDPRFGREPFVYADTVSFDIALASLWKGSLELRGIVAGGASLNLSKSDNGAWNLDSVLQSLLSVRSGAGSAAVRVSLKEGRINLKTGGQKHVLYLSNVDLAVEPSSRRAELAIRIAGELARTDRPATGFARLSGRGRVNFLDRAGGRILMNVALERTAVADLIAASGRTVPAVEGFLTCSAEVQGELSRLEIKGRMQLQQAQRWAWLWPAADAWGLDFAGVLDLANEEIQFHTPLKPAGLVPFSVRFRLRDFWRDLQWGSIVALERAPIQSAAHLIAQLGFEVPEGLKSEGELTGAIGYSPQSGVQGVIRAEAARVTSGGGSVVEIPQATVSIAQDTWRIEQTAAVIDGHEGTRVGFGYRPSEKRLDLEIDSSGLPLDVSIRCWRALAGSSPPPALEQLQKGTWRGSLRYRVEPDLPARWDGDLLVKDAELQTPLFSHPITIQTASMVLRGPNLQVQSMRGQLGETSLAGQYRFLESAVYPHRLRFAVDRMNSRTVADLIGKLTGPERGLFSRAMRMALAGETAAKPLGPAEAELAVEELILGERILLKNLTLRSFLDADQFRIQQFSGEWRRGKVFGDVEFAARKLGSPVWLARLRWEGVNWGVGTMDGEATVIERSSAREPLSDFGADGWVRILAGDGSEDQEVSNLTGCFLAEGRRGRINWTLDGVSAVIGRERYSGSGMSLPDGKIQLDLSNGVKLIRLTGSFAGQEQDLIRIQR